MGDWLSDFASDHLASSGFITLNLAYAVYAGSSLFKDMLRLRLALTLASILYIVYGLVEGVWSIVWWNIPVGLIHGWRSWGLVRQRRSAQLDDEAEAIRVLLYDSLDKVKFHRLWTLGQERLVDDGEILIAEAAPVEELMMILAGTVQITADGRHLNELGRLRFVGEMSTLSGANASASVIAAGPARVRSWNTAALEALLRESGDIERTHLRAVGRDLAHKLT